MRTILVDVKNLKVIQNLVSAARPTHGLVVTKDSVNRWEIHQTVT